MITYSKKFANGYCFSIHNQHILSFIIFHSLSGHKFCYSFVIRSNLNCLWSVIASLFAKFTHAFDCSDEHRENKNKNMVPHIHTMIHGTWKKKLTFESIWFQIMAITFLLFIVIVYEVPCIGGLFFCVLFWYLSEHNFSGFLISVYNIYRFDSLNKLAICTTITEHYRVMGFVGGRKEKSKIER